MRLRKGLLGAAFGVAVLLGQVAPAMADMWVGGHYNAYGAWVPGHWVGSPDVWIPGHYAPNGYWIPGHWRGGYGPRPGSYEGPPPGVPPYGRHWVGGFYGPEGFWHPGHWAPN
jgi:hypothetical protein